MATATATASKTTLKPLDDRVVIRPDKAEEKTASGIFIPEGAKEKPQTGKIIAVGPGKLADDGNRTKLSVKKGDTVIYGKYTGTEIEVDGDKLVIAKQDELLGVIEK